MLLSEVGMVAYRFQSLQLFCNVYEYQLFVVVYDSDDCIINEVVDDCLQRYY